MIKVVDIFAGPGGLSEGFASVKNEMGDTVFDIGLSIEKDKQAFETLKLRAFFRQFPERPPEEYYKYLRQEIDRSELYEKYPDAAAKAETKCWNVVLGQNGESAYKISNTIDRTVKDEELWILIGGPPCQAYSLAGRSRNNGNPLYIPEQDERQRLYVEYLQILAEHRPAVFVMENVKGLLSATYDNQRMFNRIVEDLMNPCTALSRENRKVRQGKRTRYKIFSLVKRGLFNAEFEGAVICAEKYGVPQARHRVILLGVNEEFNVRPSILNCQPKVNMASVTESLPPLRSGLSRQKDTPEKWVECLRSQGGSRWANAGTSKVSGKDLSKLIKQTLKKVHAPKEDRGSEFIRGHFMPNYKKEWYFDEKIGGVCNHITRAHMVKDLYRYFYAACYAQHHGDPPLLKNFPKDLRPKHANVEASINQSRLFSDRFRVQMPDRPSHTVVSHISKDGHYYIHPDPLQCRSLTVREAARLQTFPDNYFFCGSRTAQYTQVGNAVPPLIAKQIAEIVHDLLQQIGVKS